MKIVLALLIFFLLTISSNSQWVWRNPALPGNDHTEIQFINNIGYIACFGGLIKTTDGGSTWAYKHINKSSYNGSISFIDEMNGIIVNPNVYKTKDGGETWESIFSPEKHPSKYRKIQMVDKINSFILAQNHDTYYLIASTDGGLTWSTRCSFGYSNIKDIYFFDSNNGIINNYGFMKTSDGGRNWFTPNSNYDGFSTFSFLDSLNGYGLPGSYYPDFYMILKTTDGGNYWTFKNFDKVYNLKKIFCIDSLNAIAIGDSGIILRTTDDGNNWFEQTSGTNQNLTNVFFTNKENGIIVCARSNNKPEDIIKTTDGGNTWYSIRNSITNFHLNDVSFADNKIGVAVGDSGLILRTTNAGISWNKQESQTNKNFTYVDLTKGKGIAASADGLILRTSDLGLNWMHYANGNGNQFNKIFFVNDSIRAAVSGNSFLMTKNGGINWFVKMISPSKLVNLYFTSDKKGIVIGNSQNYENIDPIMKTTDGGITWSTSYYGVEGDENQSYLRNIYMVDSINGYLTASIHHSAVPPDESYEYNTSLKTTDGGTNWIDTNFIYSYRGNAIIDIHFTDVPNGMAIGNEIYQTTSDSLKWSNAGVRGRGFRSIFCIDKNNVVVVGEYGAILTLNRNVVPVELSSFLAFIEGGRISLNWSTSTETNNYGFEVQKKLDDNNYKILDFVEGAGTTSDIKNYNYVDEEVNEGLNVYRLKQIDFDGSYSYSKEVEINFNVIHKYSLSQCYPNPFNPITKINYSIAVEGQASLIIYDLLGREVKKVFNEIKKPGNYTAVIDGSELSSGIYFYKLSSGSYSSTKKMILIK